MVTEKNADRPTDRHTERSHRFLNTASKKSTLNFDLARIRVFE